jgi:hypothetical protein
MRRLLVCLITVLATAGAARAQIAPPPAAEADEDEVVRADAVVVTGQRLPGSVPGEAVPEQVLDVQAVRSLGVASLADVVNALAARSGSARGEGPPLVLLNGRRVGGFQEIRAIPSEAIARVEVLGEDVALQFGFPADQRVLNFVLRRRFRAVTAEVAGADVASGARREGRGEASLFRVGEEGRLLIAGRVESGDSILESERPIRPTGSAPRALAPETLRSRASLSAARAAGAQTQLTVNLAVERDETERPLGADPAAGGISLRDGETDTVRIGAGADHFRGRWQTALTASLESQRVRTLTRGGLRAGLAVSETETAQAALTASGPITDAPAGPVRLSLRLGLEDRAIEAETARPLRPTERSAQDRTQADGRLTLTVPLASRRREVLPGLGDLFVSATLSGATLSDAGEQSGGGATLNWAPTPSLRVRLAHDVDEIAPNLSQLGAPRLETPGSSVFDPRAGASVDVIAISGGQPGLRSERRDRTSLDLTWSPPRQEGVTVTLGYVEEARADAIAALPALSAAVEAAFADRIQRDATGRLIALDRRAVNLASLDSRRLRLAFSADKGFGPRITLPPGARPPGAGPPGAGRPGGGGGGRGGVGGAGFGGGGPPQDLRAGRWSVSIAHTLRLEETARLAAGAPALDLLAGQSLNEQAPVRRHGLELEAGVTWRGLGARIEGNWRGEGAVEGARSGLVSYDDLATLNARLFVDFNARRDLIARYPILARTRLTLRVENIADAAQRVADATGETPLALQGPVLAPRGRVVELSLRKQL